MKTSWNVDAIYKKETKKLWYIEITINGVVNQFFDALTLELWWQSVWSGKPYHEQLRWQMKCFNPLNYCSLFAK